MPPKLYLAGEPDTSSPVLNAWKYRDMVMQWGYDDTVTPSRTSTSIAYNSKEEVFIAMRGNPSMLLKLDKDGVLIKSIQTSSLAANVIVRVDKQDNVVIGDDLEDKLIKYDSELVEIWTVEFDYSQNIRDIAFDSENNIILAGVGPPVAGSISSCIMKYDSSGNLLWRQYPSRGHKWHASTPYTKGYIVRPTTITPAFSYPFHRDDVDTIADEIWVGETAAMALVPTGVEFQFGVNDPDVILPSPFLKGEVYYVEDIWQTGHYEICVGASYEDVVAGIRVDIEDDGNGIWWDPNTTYGVGVIVRPDLYGDGHTNNRNYRCTVAGTSGGTAPTWKTTVGEKFLDHVGGTLEWEVYRNTSSDEYYVQGPIEIHNWIALHDGTSGSTEPDWNSPEFELGDKVEDGSVTWLCIPPTSDPGLYGVAVDQKDDDTVYCCGDRDIVGKGKNVYELSKNGEILWEAYSGMNPAYKLAVISGQGVCVVGTESVQSVLWALNRTTFYHGHVVRPTTEQVDSYTFAVGDVDIVNDTIDVGANISTGFKLTFETSDTLPAPLVTDVTYYAINVDATHIKVATTSANATAGTAIDLTSQGTNTETGTHIVDVGEAFCYIRTFPPLDITGRTSTTTEPEWPVTLGETVEDGTGDTIITWECYAKREILHHTKTKYTVNRIIRPATDAANIQYCWKCATAGVSGSSITWPSTPVPGDTKTDGTVVWRCHCRAAGASAYLLNLSDGSPLGSALTGSVILRGVATDKKDFYVAGYMANKIDVPPSGPDIYTNVWRIGKDMVIDQAWSICSGSVNDLLDLAPFPAGKPFHQVLIM